MPSDETLLNLVALLEEKPRRVARQTKQLSSPTPTRQQNSYSSATTLPENPTTGVGQNYGAGEAEAKVCFPVITASWQVESICEFAEAKIREMRLMAKQPIGEWLKSCCIGSSLAAVNEAVEHLGQEINRLRRVDA